MRAPKEFNQVHAYKYVVSLEGRSPSLLRLLSGSLSLHRPIVSNIFTTPQCLSQVRSSDACSQFLIIILGTPAATETQIGIYNSTENKISARITNDNGDTAGSVEFFDIEPGKYELWNRSHWQVAFVLKHSVEPSNPKALTLIVKPTGVYYIND
ncbi:uncharacterized protein HD556DRAFT_1402070, partial [Suillus plorans]